jgi:small basic protein
MIKKIVIVSYIWFNILYASILVMTASVLNLHIKLKKIILWKLLFTKNHITINCNNIILKLLFDKKPLN